MKKPLTLFITTLFITNHLGVADLESQGGGFLYCMRGRIF